MNEMPSFQPSPLGLTPASDSQDRPKRNRRKPRQAQPEVEKPAEPKKPRGPKRKAKTEKASPAMVKLSVKEAAKLLVGSEAKSLLKLHKLVAPWSATTRTRLLDALQKLLG